MEALCMGQLVSRTCRGWIRNTTRFCLGSFITSTVESLCVVGHEPSFGARRANVALQYASYIMSMLKLPTHDAVFDTKRMNFLDAVFKLLPTLRFSHILETPS